MPTVNQKIADLELPFMMDDRTKGRGNCFFHAILQQVKRQELKLETYEKHDHRKLCADLCDFATTRNNESVATMAANYDLINGDDSWNAFF